MICASWYAVCVQNSQDGRHHYEKCHEASLAVFQQDKGCKAYQAKLASIPSLTQLPYYVRMNRILRGIYECMFRHYHESIFNIG